MTRLLEADDVTIDYGGVRACDHVTLHVNEGEIVGLIGPNGAGKTSLIDGITGFAARDGQVRIGGREVPRRARPHKIARMGLARTFQTLELFDDLSVRDNLSVASAVISHSTALALDLDDVIELLGLTDRQSSVVADCSHGFRQLVSVGRVLVAGAPVLVLDEPAAGLDAASRLQLATTIKSRAQQGHAVLVVDHDLELVMSLCDRIFVLDSGRILASGTPAELRTNQAVLDAYLG